MAMNKKEQVRLDEAERLVKQAEACTVQAKVLGWPTDPEPVPLDKTRLDDQHSFDVARRARGVALIRGWKFHISVAWSGTTVSVSEGWCESCSHGSGPEPKPYPNRSASQGRGPALYATRLDALLAARHQLARDCAVALFGVTVQIEEARRAV